jgi:hypothetical protein
MIDPSDVAALQSMRSKYQEAAAKIATARKSALAKLNDEYKAKAAVINQKSESDANKLGNFISSIDGLLGVPANAAIPQVADADSEPDELA